MSALLSAYLIPEGRPAPGILATHIQSPGGERFADGIWAPYGRHLGLEGYEIKVSRADVAVELSDPMKCEPWLQFCQRWWLFVADPALVDGLDIPERWGVVAPPSGRRTRSLTIVKAAPKLRPMDTGMAWQRIVTWYAVRHADQTQTNDRLRSERDALFEQLHTRRQDSSHPSSPHAQRVARLLQKVERTLSEYHSREAWTEALDDAIVAAVVDHRLVEQHARRKLAQVEDVLDTLARCLVPVRDRWSPDPVKARIAALLAESTNRPTPISVTPNAQAS